MVKLLKVVTGVVHIDETLSQKKKGNGLGEEK